MNEPSPETLTLRPIGYVRAPFVDRLDAPRQPRAAAETEATIELLPTPELARALSDLDGWQYLWVLFWFHKNKGWRPMVLPPRSERRRGVFSTRTPHRPNPIGLSVVELLRIEKTRVYVRGCDMLDGTPVLDLKPYVPWADAIPHARTGWLAPPGSGEDDSSEETQLDRDGRPVDPKPSWRVELGPLAREQLAFVATRAGLELEPLLVRTLALGPHAHPYRRIKRDGDAYVLGLRAWRVRFTVDEAARLVHVERIVTGYRPEALVEGATAEQGARPEREGLEIHRVFDARWGR